LVFAVEAVAHDVYVSYCVACGTLGVGDELPKQIAQFVARRPLNSSANAVPALAVEENYGCLVFVASYAILWQVLTWHAAVKPSFTVGTRVSPSKHAIQTPERPLALPSGAYGPRPPQIDAAATTAQAGTSLGTSGSSKSLQSRYALDSLLWNNPSHSMVWAATRYSDGTKVVIKRCRINTALRSVRADLLLRSNRAGPDGSAVSVKSENKIVDACDANTMIVVVPLLEFFYDEQVTESFSGIDGADDDIGATLVFPLFQMAQKPLTAEPPGSATALAWFWDFSLQLADRVAALHAMDLSHGDIKPSNIVVDPVTKRVCLIDMGQSQHPATFGTLNSRSGTNYWRAPELETHNGSCSSLSGDQWGLAAVILRALCCAMYQIRFEEEHGGAFDNETLNHLYAQFADLFGRPAWLDGLFDILWGSMHPYQPKQLAAADMLHALHKLHQSYVGA